tara:strand:+ start:1065 stop:1814 length:750 start_codon:yes stop_codon:yes gene_type:complete
MKNSNKVTSQILSVGSDYFTGSLKVSFLKRTCGIFIFVLCFNCSSQYDMETPFEVKDEESTESTENTTISEADYHILFVGNSLTYTNNLPKLVEEEAERKGVLVKTKSISKPNYAIVDHWADGEVQELIRSKKYNYVILQQGPSSQMDGYDMLVNDAAVYADLCSANNTKLTYFMVWPARYNYHTFQGVITNYTAGAQANNAILCPVGAVWKDYFDATQDFSYYGPDDFHPSLKGSKVAAEIIVETIFN